MNSLRNIDELVNVNYALLLLRLEIGARRLAAAYIRDQKCIDAALVEKLTEWLYALKAISTTPTSECFSKAFSPIIL